MAHYVEDKAIEDKRGPMGKLARLFIKSSDDERHEDSVYSLPIFQRRDGAVIKLGYLVRRGEGRLYTVKDILVSSNLDVVTLALRPVEGDGDVVKVASEVTVVSVEEVEPVEGRKVSLSVARDGMEIVAKGIDRYPIYIQRVLRRHQIASLMRREVQQFLGGFSMARSCNLGPVDWRFDPGILGLERETDFSLDYRIERFANQSSHLDLLLGSGWDVRVVAGSAGFRILLTLELMVDINQQLNLTTHATLCTGGLPHPLTYRADSLKQSEGIPLNDPGNLTLQSVCGGTLAYEPVSTDNSIVRKEGSLDWEEFQNNPELDNTIFINSSISKSNRNLLSLSKYNSDYNILNSDCSNIDPIQTSNSNTDYQKLVFNVSKECSEEYNNKVTDDSENIISPRHLLLDALNMSSIEEYNAGESRSTSTPTDEPDEASDSFINISDLSSSPKTHVCKDVENFPLGPVAIVSNAEIINKNYSNEIIPENQDEVLIKEAVDDLNNLTNNENGTVADFITPYMNDSYDVLTKNQDELPIEEPVDDFSKLAKNLNSLDTLNEPILIPNDEHVNFPNLKVNHRFSNSPLDGSLSSTSRSLSEGLYNSSSIVTSQGDKMSLGEDQEVEYEENSTPRIHIENVAEDGQFNDNEDITNVNNKSNAMLNPVTKALDYVQTLPSPQNISKVYEIGSSSEAHDSSNISLSSSLSKTSRLSDISSINGTRFSSSGLFYGTASGVHQPSCPFPDDWQFNIIPETIENDEELD